MGAHDYTITYMFDSRMDVRDAWDRQVEQDGYESGSGSYAGNATTMRGSISWKNLLLPSESDAVEKVLELHEKWSGPIACSFYRPAEPSISQKKKVEKLKNALHKAKNRKFAYMQKVVQSFLSRKTLFVGCKECGSKLSLKHMEQRVRSTALLGHTLVHNYPKLPKCPVCEHDLISHTHNERVKSLDDTVKKIQNQLLEARKPPASKDIGWVVGGWAAS